MRLCIRSELLKIRTADDFSQGGASLSVCKPVASRSPAAARVESVNPCQHSVIYAAGADRSHDSQAGALELQQQGAVGRECMLRHLHTGSTGRPGQTCWAGQAGRAAAPAGLCLQLATSVRRRWQGGTPPVQMPCPKSRAGPQRHRGRAAVQTAAPHQGRPAAPVPAPAVGGRPGASGRAASGSLPCRLRMRGWQMGV